MNERQSDKNGHRNEWLIAAGAVVLVLVIFGVPAVLVPATMKDVPARSEARVLTWYQTAVDVVEKRFHDHASPGARRHSPLPSDSTGWIELINPMGRKAPGGGPAVLPVADETTGAIGVSGDSEKVTIVLPGYGNLERFEYTTSLEDISGEDPASVPGS